MSIISIFWGYPNVTKLMLDIFVSRFLDILPNWFSWILRTIRFSTSAALVRSTSLVFPHFAACSADGYIANNLVWNISDHGITDSLVLPTTCLVSYQVLGVRLATQESSILMTYGLISNLALASLRSVDIHKGASPCCSSAGFKYSVLFWLFKGNGG